MAHSMLQHGWYHPHHSSDIWALGLLMLEVVGGAIPDEQWDLQNRQEYLRELKEEGSSVLTQQPAYREYLQYLSDLISKPGQQDYADQVGGLYLLAVLSAVFICRLMSRGIRGLLSRNFWPVSAGYLSRWLMWNARVCKVATAGGDSVMPACSP